MKNRPANYYHAIAMAFAPLAVWAMVMTWAGLDPYQLLTNPPKGAIEGVSSLSVIGWFLVVLLGYTLIKLACVGGYSVFQRWREKKTTT